MIKITNQEIQSSGKTNKKKTLTVVIVLAVVLAALVSIFAIKSCGEKKVLIAAGSEGGYYYEFSSKLAETLKGKGYEPEIQKTEGTLSNIDLVNSGVAKIGLAQADIVSAHIALAKEEKEDIKYHILGSAYNEAIHLVVPASSKITSVTDLKGKNVAIGEEGSGTSLLAVDIIDHALITSDSITTKNLTYDESKAALKKGEIDAFFYVGKAGSSVINKLAQENDVRIISLPEDLISYISSNAETRVITSIPAGTYKGQDSEIKTVGIPAVLLASNSLGEEDESAIIAAISESGLGELKAIDLQNSIEEPATAIKVNVNMYLTLTMSVACLALGVPLRKKIGFLSKFSIPAPVVGGLIFSITTCILYTTGIIEISFDETLKNVCMTLFFTSVGFQANIKELKRGGSAIVVLLICSAVLMILQNVVGVGLAKTMGQSALLGLTTGSIPLVGGHGTAGAFGPILEGLGLESATTLCTSAATFGIIMGSLMGGPMATGLIKRKNLVETAVPVEKNVTVKETVQEKAVSYGTAAYQLAIAMGLGSIVSMIFENIGLTFPSYIGAMIIAAIMRNVSEMSGLYKTPMKHIDDIGGICLSLFLGIAMISLKLWQLASLALPLIILLVAQTLLMYLYGRFVVFNAMGRDYDAAIITSGVVGFGMGATANAMANMQALTDKHVPSVKAFIVVPLVGALFADFINSGIITAFINIFR